MSATAADRQFQHCATQPSNLDRCNRCGLYRSAHGLDWSCPAGPSGGARSFLLITGAVLAVAGAILWGLTGSAPSALNTLAAFAFPGGLVLIISALVRTGRAEPEADAWAAELAELLEAEDRKAREERRPGW
jgi:hypothetical protein